MIHELAQLPSGSVRRCDIIDALGERVRTFDPARFTRFRDEPFGNATLRAAEDPVQNLRRLLRFMPRRYRDVFDWLREDPATGRFRDDGLRVPVGFDHLVMFAMLFNLDSGPVVFSTADVSVLFNGAEGDEVTKSKPALPHRWGLVTLVGAGGGGGGGARVTTSGNHAAGGGGGAGGGLIQRIVLLSSLDSTYTMTTGFAANTAAAQSTANTDGEAGTAGSDSTFTSTIVLTAGGGGAGGGGSQGSGTRTGTGGTGGTGDIAGGNGGVGISDGTVGAGVRPTTGAAGSGGGGGGGAVADTDRKVGGFGGHDYTTGIGRGDRGTTVVFNGQSPTSGSAGGGGGCGENASNNNAGDGGSASSLLSGFGGGGGGGGGRARTAATTTGNGGKGGKGGGGFAMFVGF